MKKLLSIATVAGLSLSSTVFADSPTNPVKKKIGEASETPMMKQTIAEIAMDDERFTTLVAALKATGLDKTLNKDGVNYTVFAPTNEAFDKLPKATLDSLMLPENKDKLTKILTHHVVPAKLMAVQVVPGDVRTVGGDTFTVTTEGGAVMLDNAKVTETDISGTNGVIHVIDTVLIPDA